MKFPIRPSCKLVCTCNTCRYLAGFEVSNSNPTNRASSSTLEEKHESMKTKQDLGELGLIAAKVHRRGQRLRLG
jgi:hypothetical protein